MSRVRAALIGLGWLGFVAVSLFAISVSLPVNDWRLLWLRERATAVALGSVLLFTGAGMLMFTVVGIRSLALAFWPKETFIEIGPVGVRMELGPYGRFYAEWKDVELKLRDDFDPDVLDYIPDAALAIELRHRQTGEDYAELIQRVGRITPEEFNRLLRPYLPRPGQSTEAAQMN
ncbi:hypothetical protein RAS2_13570 [Phycisphaerae bacterium RAS2]|nr:hypothetical protein RAS2_13570 [Phycisphaerae bacterium RAS2]